MKYFGSCYLSEKKIENICQIGDNILINSIRTSNHNLEWFFLFFYLFLSAIVWAKIKYSKFIIRIPSIKRIILDLITNFRRISFIDLIVKNTIFLQIN